MQTAPWLGLIPGADGQILHSQEEGDSPMVTLFKSATTATMSDPNCTSPTSFHTISRQAEAAGRYLFNIQPFNKLVNILISEMLDNLLSHLKSDIVEIFVGPSLSGTFLIGLCHCDA